MINRRTLLAMIGLGAVAPSIPAVAAEPAAPPAPFKGHGVVTWEPVPDGLMYYVSIKNHQTREITSYFGSHRDGGTFRFDVSDPTHVFTVKVTAVSLDGRTLSVPRQMLEFVEATA